MVVTAEAASSSPSSSNLVSNRPIRSAITAVSGRRPSNCGESSDEIARHCSTIDLTFVT